MVWAKSKSAMATVGAMIVGMLVLAFIMNADWLGQRTADDIKNRENGAAVVQVEAGPW
jgi:hypothetical protein